MLDRFFEQDARNQTWVRGQLKYDVRSHTVSYLACSHSLHHDLSSLLHLKNFVGLLLFAGGLVLLLGGVLASFNTPCPAL